MAEAATKQLSSGYDEHFVNVVEEDFQCSICHLPLKEPVQTRCGHRFCKDCLEEHLRRQGVQHQPLTCPADREGLDQDRDVFPDRATERKILSFAIKCPSEECEWTGELRNKEKHLDCCVFELVLCTNENCHVKIQRKHLEEHVTTTCQWKILICDHCREPHPECKMQTHLTSCPFRDVPCTNENCPEILKQKDLSEHVCVTCQWRIFLCENCSEAHPKCQIEDHVREQCKLRPIPCPHKCGALNLRHEELQNHLETCECFPVKCPNKCEAVISREMVSNHIEDYCPLTKIPCPYAWMGCRTEVQRDQLESHIEFSTESHLNLTCRELKETQEKSKKIFKDIQLKVDFLQRQHQQGVGILQEQFEKKLYTNQAKLEKKHKQLERKLNTNQTELEKKHQQLERELNIILVKQHQHEEKLKTLEQEIRMDRKIFWGIFVLGLLFVPFFATKHEDRVQQKLEEELKILEVDTEETCSFIWKITSFEDKLGQLKSNGRKYIKSVPFYAYGYKLMLRLYPNGVAAGENTHLSIFMVVMKGEYDAILPWGFSKQVKFTLIDQQDDPNQRKNHVLPLTADPQNKAFKKPLKQENRAWGFPKFLSQNILRTRRFLVDDTLFIKFEVNSAAKA